MQRSERGFAIWMAMILTACATAAPEPAAGPGDIATHEQELAINSANDPSRFGLTMVRNVFSLPRSGESVKKPFPAYWWPYRRNGIAYRWQGSGTLSPVEKYDRLVGQGSRGTNWELSRHGLAVNPASWWGHCNGWASYTLNEDQPQRAVNVRFSNGAVSTCTAGTTGCIRFEVGDIDGLMTELYLNDRFRILAGRCRTNSPGYDLYGRAQRSECLDVNPGSLHIVTANMLGSHRRMFILDRNADLEVWNYPAFRFEVSRLVEVNAATALRLIGASGTTYFFNTAARRFFDVTLRIWIADDAIPPTTYPTGQYLSQYSHVMTYTYVLEASSDGTIIGGEFTGSSKRSHPDFLWYSTGHSPTMTDDDLSDGDNPYIRYSVVKAISNLAR
jgi:hypothetical protein